jgi:hypothetical protein
VQSDVRLDIADDPRDPYAREIAVDAHGGAMTLRGTVSSFAEKQAAVSDAHRARGVIDVYDELQVRLLGRDRRQDAETRGAALQRLLQHHSDKAFDHVAGLRRIAAVTDEIKVAEQR